MVSPRRCLALALLALFACGDGSSGDAGSGTETTSTGGASSTVTPTTDGSSTGMNASTGSTDSTGSASSTSTTTDSSTGDSESGPVGTTGEVACGLVEQACAAVEAYGAYDDCGVVDPWNDLAPAWQAARDCALKAASEQRAFKLVTWLQGFDSQVGQAYVGLPAESFAISMFHFDSDPCGGGGCGPVASQSSCETLVAVADCVVEPGGPCLACVGQTEPQPICGPR